MSRRVLICGDSPLIKTGFGRVNALVAKRFQQEGWEVASVAGLTKEPPKDDEGIKIYVPSGSTDVLGIMDIPKAVEEFKPDVAYMTADPGSVTALAYGLPDMPAFVYTPIEGEPITNRDWRMMLTLLPLATCSQYGQGVIKKSLNRDVPYYYHGVNHDTFKVTGQRDEVRKAMKWEDKFVVMCVATNVRRKQLTRLIEAISITRHKYKVKDIVLYLHTVPFQNYWLEGWNLPEVSRSLGVNEDVYFHPKMFEFNSSIPEVSGNPRDPGLVELYQAADLFVLPSQVEGFGLPIAEAMACGVPVLVTKYAAGWEVSQPAGRGIPVIDWEIHKSGTVYANVNTELMAKEIVRLKRNPKELKRMSEDGLRRVQDFRWEPYLNDLTSLVENAIVTHEERRIAAEEEDKRNSTAKEEALGVGTLEVEDGSTSSDDISSGQGQNLYGPEQKDQNQQEAKEEEATKVADKILDV